MADLYKHSAAGVSLVCLLIAIGLLLLMVVSKAKAIEPMTCNNFNMFSTFEQNEYLLTEFTNKIKPSLILSMCARKNVEELRKTATDNCSKFTNFEKAIEIAFSKIRTKCVINDEFDVESDIWEDLEIPFFYIPRP